jgi:hypothetical protein
MSKSTSSERAIEKKVPWIPIILVTILISVVAQCWVILAGAMSAFYSLGIILCSIAISTSYYIYHVLLAGITQLTSSKWLASKLTPENLLYIYIIGSCITWYVAAVGGHAMGVQFHFVGPRVMEPEQSLKYYPLFVAPSPDVCKLAFPGGNPVPWSEWIPFIVFWWLHLYGVGLLFTATATILRKDWIDVERIPFQQVMILYEFIKRMPTPEKPKSKLSLTSPFSIGVLLGIIFNLPILLIYLFPWFPDIYAWRRDTCGHGSIMSASAGLRGTPLWELVGIGFVNKHPLAVGVMYMAPLNVLFNVWFWYFVYLILMQIAYYMGYYTGLRDATGCCREWGPVSIRFSPPFKWIAFMAGGMIAATFFYLLLRWRYIRDTLRAAFGGYEEFEKGEPTSYRIAWLLLVAAFILIMAIWMAAGMGIVAAFLLPLSLLLFWTCESRIWGMTGTYIRGAEHGNALYRLLLWPTAPSQYTGEYVLGGVLSRSHSDCPEALNSGSLFSAFSSYRLAYLLNVDSRKVFKTLLAVQAIVPLVSTVTGLWLIYTIGANRAGYWGFYVDVITAVSPDWWNRLPGEDPWIHIFAVGFIAVGLVSYLHSRFMWFPFEPIGFLTAFSMASIFFGVWLPALIAWILKYITLKIGGSKAYEGYGVPIASGFTIGFILIAFLGGLIGVYRFFVPF